MQRVRRPWEPPDDKEPEQDEIGVAVGDERWRVPWLQPFLKVPRDATWPRLMSLPHPAAAGSLGPEFVAAAEQRSGRPLRWWQKLTATRVLEVDADGRLVWETAIVSMARQLGKSWLFRELCWWRIQQGERFGEPQTLMHSGKDLAIVKEVSRDIRLWAKAYRDVYKVREAAGREEIEHLPDGSRWLMRAREAVYGYSVSCAFVDEGWKIPATSVEEALVPTMSEREQPQLWLVSTAHRLATSLMLRRRSAALAALETGDGDLLVEWSAPRSADVEDVAAWRQASPHWSARRERDIGRRLAAARAGETSEDEPDPLESFRAQWLNQWPKSVSPPKEEGELLLPSGVWAGLAEQGPLQNGGPVFVALEDDFGLGAAVAAASRLADGRIELDGWLCPDWDTALNDAARLRLAHRVQGLFVGASLLSRCPPGTYPVPEPAGRRETPLGLALLRDLAASGDVVHTDDTGELDQAIEWVRVKEQPGGQLQLAAHGPTHLVRALSWALLAAHRPARVPAVR